MSRYGPFSTSRAVTSATLRLLAVLAVATALALTAGLAAAEGGRPFHTALTGAAEAPGPGDPDGSGSAHLTLNQGQGEICYSIEVSGLALPATGAHIHAGAEGSPGPVVVPLTAPNATGVSSGCATVDHDLIRTIRQNPSDYYVNVHTPEFPAGAVRGQLSK